MIERTVLEIAVHVYFRRMNKLRQRLPLEDPINQFDQAKHGQYPREDQVSQSIRSILQIAIELKRQDISDHREDGQNQKICQVEFSVRLLFDKFQAKYHQLNYEHNRVHAGSSSSLKDIVIALRRRKQPHYNIEGKHHYAQEDIND